MIKSNSMIKDSVAYILAGGKSQRMGRDKANLEWSGTTFLESIYSSLKTIFKEVFIIVKKKEDDDSRYLEDLLDIYSPLTGIYTALKHTDKEFVFIKACDNPLVSEKLIFEMYKFARDYDVVVPKAPDGLHPLYAFYSKRILPEIEKFLSQNSFKIINLYESLKVKYIVEREIKKFDKKMVTLRNINTPDDYNNFKELLREG
ncbi:MAG: molybdenum cofactor guanylyltransferase [Proteobacteria bacterium]|nr:molybdenum cofactor guanylyltransferase [Pseudomonadota bacterium]